MIGVERVISVFVAVRDRVVRNRVVVAVVVMVVDCARRRRSRHPLPDLSVLASIGSTSGMCWLR